MTKHYPVIIYKRDEKKVYSSDFQTQATYADGWKAILSSAHRYEYPITCACPGNHSRSLSVRYITDGDSYYLARYPKSGEQHAFDCRYYSPDPNKTGLSGYHSDVVEEKSNGDISVKLNLSLRINELPDSGEPVAVRQANSDAKYATKPAMTLLGLLNLIWTEAGLNVWSPNFAKKKRTVSFIHSRLVRTASRITTNHMRLNEALVVSTPESGGRQEEANIAKVKSATRNKRRLLIIAPLASYNEERASGVKGFLAVKYPNGLPLITYDQALWSAVSKRYSRQLSAWGKGQTIVAIVQADQPSNENKAKALNIAIMVVSSEWIPVDSSYESIVEKKLRDEGRHFYKPLRFDSENEVVFPDFWLLDLPDNREFPMEVFGMDSSEYIERKHEKVEHYNSVYGAKGWWMWDVTIDRNGVETAPLPAPKH
ncbi:DUF1173 family protein [Pseudomonas sp. zjy_14]|uniref:DUF1173 family protein n=1 Tax=Pseudomonas sp. zjy_14 TaxID=3367264 RepID=UPI00370B528E